MVIQRLFANRDIGVTEQKKKRKRDEAEVKAVKRARTIASASNIIDLTED